MAASGSNSGAGKNHRPPAPAGTQPLQSPVTAPAPTHCESCRSAPAIPFCRVEWSFLCAGCAPVVHSNSWIVAVNPNPSSPYPYPYPQPFSVPNPNPNNPNPNPRYRERKRTRKAEVRSENRSTDAESMPKAAAVAAEGQGIDGEAGSDGGREGGSTAAVVLV